MPTYLVMAPNLSINAEVDAPDSRHARTTFLDYLSRNHLIPYTERQVVRRVLMTKRVDPGEVSTTVQLSYRSGVMPQQVPEEIAMPETAQISAPTESQEVTVAPQEVAPAQGSGTGFEQSAVFKMSRSFGGR